jgi:hypothetical protein
LLLCLCLAGVIESNAQGNIFPSSGNAGIDTTTPQPPMTDIPLINGQQTNMGLMALCAKKIHRLHLFS